MSPDDPMAVYRTAGGTIVTVSPIGAIVMAHNSHGDYSWSVPDNWDRGDYWTRYPAIAVFAQYLAMDSVDEYAGADNPADVINTWTRHRARTEKQIITALRDAARAARDADRDSKLLAVL